MRAAAARLVEAQRIAAAAAAGAFAVEVTADGVRLRDDLPVPYNLTTAAVLALASDDAPIPLALA